MKSQDPNETLFAGKLLPFLLIGIGGAIIVFGLVGVLRPPDSEPVAAPTERPVSKAVAPTPIPQPSINQTTLPTAETLPQTRDSMSSVNGPVESGEGGTAGLPTEEAQAIIGELIIAENRSFGQIVDDLLGVLPKFNEEDQAATADHIRNLTDDAKLREMTPLIVGNSLPKAVMDTLVPDLLNRPHEVAMPIMAGIAEMTDHPHHADAVETLEFLYGAPEGGATWRNWVERKIAEESGPGNALE